MSLAQDSSLSFQAPQTAKPEEIVRPLANFHPDIWGDQFINYDSQDMVRNA